MQLWLCPLVAFLLGSIPFGLFIAKAKGIDIRQHGSGNIGATNVLRVVGKKYGITCLILDGLKGFLPVILALNLLRIEGRNTGVLLSFLDPYALHFPLEQPFTAQLVHVITGLCAILGHNYSPWIGFKGGKGIATSAGVLFGLFPLFGMGLLLIIWGVVFLISRYVSLASIIASAMLPVLTIWGAWHHGLIQNGTWNKPLFFFSLLVAVLAIWKHRANIQRLLDGTENRFTRKPKSA